MQHHFDVDTATKYGVLEAILLNHIEYWVQKNEANGVNYHDGAYWTFNSARAFSVIFPYASRDRIKRALKHLRDEDLIRVGNFNDAAYDRTLWYTLTEKAQCIAHRCAMESAKIDNPSGPDAPPIPDKKHNIKNTENNNSSAFKRPTVEEVREYCADRKNTIDAQRFVDYYTSNGWKVGKNPMKDWKAAVRTWERNAKQATEFVKQEQHFANERKYDDDFFAKLEGQK